jgi:hypothetical protein
MFWKHSFLEISRNLSSELSFCLSDWAPSSSSSVSARGNSFFVNLCYLKKVIQEYENTMLINPKNCMLRFYEMKLSGYVKVLVVALAKLYLWGFPILKLIFFHADAESFCFSCITHESDFTLSSRFFRFHAFTQEKGLSCNHVITQTYL